MATVSCSQATVLDALKNKSGQKWEVEPVETEKMMAKGKQMIEEGNFMGMLILAQAAAFGKIAGIEEAELSPSNTVVGLPVEGSLEQTVAEVLR